MARYIHDDERRFPPWEFIDTDVYVFREKDNKKFTARIKAYDPQPDNQIDVSVSIKAGVIRELFMVWDRLNRRWESGLKDDRWYLEVKAMPNNFIKYCRLPKDQREKIFPECIPVYEDILYKYMNLIFNALKGAKKSIRPFEEENKFFILFCLLMSVTGILKKEKQSNLIEASMNFDKFHLSSKVDISLYFHARTVEIYNLGAVNYEYAIDILFQSFGRRHQNIIQKMKDKIDSSESINLLTRIQLKQECLKFLQEGEENKGLDPYKERFTWDTKIGQLYANYLYDLECLYL